MPSIKKAKNKKVLTILVIAIFLCILSGIGVYQILAPMRTTVYVFNNDYSAGTQISKSMLEAVDVDSNLIASAAKVSTGEYFITQDNYNTVLQSAGILRADVHGGTALMKSMLTTTGGNAIEMTMKRNAVSVTIGVTPVSGVTNELSAGSRVNVYTSYDGETSLPLQNVRVLSVGKSDGVLARATLEVDVSQSMQLIHAYTYGTVHLGLVDATGYQFTSNVRPTYTVGGFGVDATTGQSGTTSEPALAPAPESTPAINEPNSANSAASVPVDTEENITDGSSSQIIIDKDIANSAPSTSETTGNRLS